MEAVARPLRVNAGGNYCGHNPSTPRLAVPEPPTKTPLVLRRADERFGRYYYTPEFTLPGLNQVNGSSRRQRSERREAEVLAVGAIFKHTDLASLRCGQPTEEGFLNYTVKYLAEQAGLGLRRMQRCIADLKAAGMLSVHRITEKQEDGTYKGFAAVKAVSAKLFVALGLGPMLHQEREKASKRLRKTAPADPRARAKRSLSLGPLNEALKRRMSPRAADPRAGFSDHDKRRLTALELALRAEHPDWPLDTIRKVAQQAL